MTPEYDFSYQRFVFGRRSVLLLGALLPLLTAAPADASPGDVYGIGGRAIARSGAVMVDAKGSESLHYNPSGLMETDRPEISLGYHRAFHNLRYRSEHEGEEVAAGDAHLPELNSLQLGLALPIANRIALGAQLSFLPTSLTVIRTLLPEQPYMPYFENRTERLFFLIGAAARLTDKLSFGLALNVFAQVNGIARASEGPTRDVEPHLSINGRTLIRINFGFRYLFDEKQGIGFNFRQRFEAPIVVQTVNAVGGVPFSVDLDARTLQNPAQVTLGYYRAMGDFRLEGNFGWYRYSQLRAPHIEVEADLSGIPLWSGPMEEIYRDAIDLRVGGEYQLALASEHTLQLRGGVHYQSPITREAIGEANHLDGHKIGGSIGAGVRLAFPRSALRIDLYGMSTGLVGTNNVKDPEAMFDENERLAGVQTSNPGYSEIRGRGGIYAFGLTLTMELPE